MNLYLLTAIVDWRPWYDTAQGFVIRATNENEARVLASRECGDEGEKVWIDPKKTLCVVLSSEGEIGIILRDFSAA